MRTLPDTLLGDPPGYVVGGSYDFLPNELGFAVTGPRVGIKYYWHDPEEVDLYRKAPNGSWQIVTDGRLVEPLDDSMGIVSAYVTQLGHFIALVDGADAVGIGNPQRAPRFALFQSYPNPAGSNVDIKYEIPVQGHVTVRIFTDVAGRLVRTLVDTKRGAGPHTAVWDRGN